jgi:toxin ParE1/3/4
MKIVWSRRAIRHLAAIRDFIAEDNPSSAAAIAAQIVDSVELLVAHPQLGRAGRVPGTRELVIAGTPYVVPYRIRRDRLDLIAVFHGRQKWPERL